MPRCSFPEQRLVSGNAGSCFENKTVTLNSRNLHITSIHIGRPATTRNHFFAVRGGHRTHEITEVRCNTKPAPCFTPWQVRLRMSQSHLLACGSQHYECLHSTTFNLAHADFCPQLPNTEVLKGNKQKSVTLTDSLQGEAEHFCFPFLN